MALAIERTSASGSATIGAIDSVSMIITYTGVLAIELVDFDVQKIADGIRIHWSTTSEIDHDYFELQRSEDGFNFNAIERIEGQGNKSELTHYEAFDFNPKEGTNYCRLKSRDFEGKEEYSLIRTVDFVGSYGGPFDALMAFANQAVRTHGSVDMEISDVQGRRILHAKFSDVSHMMQALESTHGLFIVRLNSGESSRVFKLGKY